MMTVLGRQAVVVIHGIGEQAPLSTVRAFVGRRTARSRGEEARGGVVTPHDRVFAEPSPVGVRSDDLTYAVTWNHAEVAAEIGALPGGRRVQERSAVTEFHEFYWAPRFRSTTLGQVTGWVVPLLLRPIDTYTTRRLVGPSGLVRLVPAILVLVGLGVAVAHSVGAVPRGWAIAAVVVSIAGAILVGTLLGLVATLRVVLLSVLAAVVASFFLWGFGTVRDAVTSVVTSAVVVAVGGWVASLIVKTLGDAARYLAGTSPANVEENEVIREQVLGLLTRMHDARDPDTGRDRYDRIVVVGHSLGSVIAYDAVRLLWARRSRDMPLPGTDAGSAAAEAVAEVERTGEALRLAAGPERDAARDAFVAAQRSAQLVMRDLDHRDGRLRWAITDLVTLGSPLTYADALMASSLRDLSDRFEERSLASTPPAAQQVRRASGHPYRLWIPGPDGGTTRWHHAAPFACVEWTNAWFEHDIVGGPLGPHFGPGVRDVSLGGTRWLAGMAFAYPHSSYWIAAKRSLVRAGSDKSRALLRSVVRRRPTLLLTARAPLDDARLRELVELLGSESDGAEPQHLVDVRLYVGATDPERRPAYLPVDRVPLPSVGTVRAVKRALGDGSRVALLASPDLLADPAAPPGATPELPTTLDPGASTTLAEADEDDMVEVELPQRRQRDPEEEEDEPIGDAEEDEQVGEEE